MRLESQVIDVEGKTYMVYFRYWPAEHTYPTEPDTPEEIEIETIYELVKNLHFEDEAKIRQALFAMKRENENAASSQSEE